MHVLKISTVKVEHTFVVQAWAKRHALVLWRGLVFVGERETIGLATMTGVSALAT